jgi:hypothetical protein
MLPRRQVFTGILVTRYSQCNLRTHSVATVYIILLPSGCKSKQVSRKWERWMYCFCLVIVSRHRYFKIVFSLCKLPCHVVNHIKRVHLCLVLDSRNRHKRPYCYSTLLLFYTAASETRSRNDENERFPTFETHTRVSVDACLFKTYFKIKEDTASNSVETDGPSRMKQPNHRIFLKLISPPSSIDKSRLDGIIRGLYRWFGYSFVGACGSNPKSIDNPPCLLQHSPPSPVRNWMAQQQKKDPSSKRPLYPWDR